MKSFQRYEFILCLIMWAGSVRFITGISLCHIEMHRITQFIVTTAKGLQNFSCISNYFLVIQGWNYKL